MTAAAAAAAAVWTVQSNCDRNPTG